MAKGIRLGVGGVKVSKKCWVGVGGAARKVKKIFAGVGGVKLTYSAEPSRVDLGIILSMARATPGAARAGSYILIGGGYVSYQTFTDTVDAFNTSLVRTSAPVLHKVANGYAAASVGNYGLFTGVSDVVTAYSAGLVKSTPTKLSQIKTDVAAIEFANYAWFTAGRITSSISSTRSELYNSSLVKSRAPDFDSYAAGDMAAACTPNHVLFAGGERNNTTGVTTDLVYAFTTSLVMSRPTTLSATKRGMSAASVGNYAIFLGGYASYSSNIQTAVEAYNASLVKTLLTPLDIGIASLGAWSLDGLAVFAGGRASTYANDTKKVFTYDVNLVKGALDDLSRNRYVGGCEKIGNYFIFAGGQDDSAVPINLNTVDVYEI